MPSLLVALLLLAPPSLAAADTELWESLRRGGHVVLLRHAATLQGVTDSTGARIEDCVSARSLTEAGRDDARRLGAAFRAHGVPVGRILSSPWCRCLETARLAFGRGESWSLLDSRTREADRAPTLRELVGRRPENGNLVLVTHGAIVRPLTGIQPSTAEIVVLAPERGGRFRVAGRLAPDALR